jgi:hypothetical protein
VFTEPGRLALAGFLAVMFGRWLRLAW